MHYLVGIAIALSVFVSNAWSSADHDPEVA